LPHRKWQVAQVEKAWHLMLAATLSILHAAMREKD